MFPNLLFIRQKKIITTYQKIIPLKHIVIVPHQSASQTASPEGSLKPPELREFYANNKNTDRENKTAPLLLGQPL
jgi:hypothetical protein